MGYVRLHSRGISRPMKGYSGPDDATLARIATIRAYEIQLGYVQEETYG